MSATLTTAEWCQERFPGWRKFCDIDDFEGTPEDLFDIAREMAEVELLEYIDVDVSTITPALKHHLLNITKKVCFNFRHDDAQFDKQPQIVVDYEKSIAMLEQYRNGELPNAPEPGDNADTVTMSAKDRKFERWFTDAVLTTEEL